MKRYPGPRPFDYDDKEVFFGRENELEYLSTLVLNNKTTVVQGKSGYGKSSLISAGIIPQLLETTNCEIIRVRFYNFDKKRMITPTETLLNALRIQQTSEGVYLKDILPTDHVSAWRLLKKLQVDSQKIIEKIAIEKKQLTGVGVGESPFVSEMPEISYILIFDQFEELFTYPAKEVQRFGKELFDVVQNRIPESVQGYILEKCKEDDQSVSKEIAVMNMDLPVKMLFSIRSDRFNYLTYLKDYLPSLLNNTYKLRRMTVAQVTRAIQVPAGKSGDFECPSFEIDPALLAKIMDFLSSTNADDKKVEVFEMQIICSKLETIAENYAKSLGIGTKFNLTEEIVIKVGGIKKGEDFLSRFIQNYYRETIESIAEENQRLAARFLIENRLLDEVSKNRISLDYVFINRIGISKSTLAHLVDQKIVRVESNSTNGKNYEISHDSLVRPILAAATEMGDLDKRTESFVLDTLKPYHRKEGREFRNALIKLSEPEKAEKGLSKKENDPNYDSLRKNLLVTEINYSASNKGSDDRLFVKEAFSAAVQKVVSSMKQESLNARLKKYTVIIGMAALAITVLAVAAFYLDNQRKKYRGLVYMGYDVDTIQNKYHALAYSSYLYEKPWNDRDSRDKIMKKMQELLHAPQIQDMLRWYGRSFRSTQFAVEDIDLSADGKLAMVRDPDTSLKETYVFGRTGNGFSFKKARFSYFLNSETPMVAAVFKDAAAGDKLVLYNAYSGETLFSTFMGRKRALFPPTGYGMIAETEYDSRRIRMTASGKLLIPFEDSTSDGTVGKLQLQDMNGQIIRTFKSDFTVSLSKDRRLFMIGRYESDLGTVVEIFDGSGNFKDSLHTVYFADFTPSGSLVFIREGYLYLRDYDSSGNHLPEQTFWVDDFIDYAYVNKQGTWAMAKSWQTAWFINLRTGKVSYQLPKSELAGFDLDKEIVYRLDSSETGMETRSDFIEKRNLSGGLLKKFPSGNENREHMIALQYNEEKDELLIQTSDNMLLLLDASLNIKTGLQITTNDPFQFSRNGAVFFYMLNQRFSVFENNKDLVNFREEGAYRWLKDRLKHNEKETEDILEQYKR